MGKLTVKKIQGIQFSGKTQKYFDGEGLFLFVNESGKYWRYKYRFGGKEKTLSIGVFPSVTLKEARESHQAARAQLARGVDPGHVKKIKKRARQDVAANTFGDLAWEWFSKQTWVDTHRVKQEGRLNNDILPYLRNKAPKEITALDILDICLRVESRGAYDAAHRIKGIIGQVFRYGIPKGVVDSDPTRDLRKALTPYKSKPMAAPTNPAEVAGLMRAIEHYQGDQTIRAALQLSPLVFVRPGELRNAEWAEFDFPEAMWRIPGPKMKGRRPHMVPLSRQALSIIIDLQSLTGDGKYLFPSVRTKSRPISNNTINAALRRMGFTKKEITAHGFRSIAATLLHEQGWDTNIIEIQLAHKDQDQVRGVYNRAKYLPQRIEMMQAWADYLDKLKFE